MRVKLTRPVTTDIHSNDNIRAMLDELASRDLHIRAAVLAVGYPEARVRDHSFDTLLSVIAGQQLSVKAAATINGRVRDLMDGQVSPEKLSGIVDEALRGAGLSWQKISYVRSLASAVLEKRLVLADLPHMSDEDAMAAIVQVKGLGRWSAEMYLMFALGRPDIWPVDDLAVRAGISTIIRNGVRGKPKEVDGWGERWRPYRSAVALLAWHYYSNPPLQ